MDNIAGNQALNDFFGRALAAPKVLRRAEPLALVFEDPACATARARPCPEGVWIGSIDGEVARCPYLSGARVDSLIDRALPVGSDFG